MKNYEKECQEKIDAILEEIEEIKKIMKGEL